MLASSNAQGEAGETTRLRWSRLSMFVVLFMSLGCGESGIGESPPTPGGFFPGLTTGVAATSATRDVPVPRSTAGFVDIQCKEDADLALRAGAIDQAVGMVTYAWLSEEQAQSLAGSGFTPNTKTTEFEDRVRLMGTADEADEVDIFLSSVNGTLTSWPRFWATRVGNPTESPHLLQITLRPEALWLAQVGSELVLIDSLGSVSPFVGATATTLKQLAGVFFASFSTASDGCDGPPFAARALVLTNLDLVDHWALGTGTVLDEVESELAALNGFAASVRACAFPFAFDAWSATVACTPNPDPALLWSGYARNLASLDQAYHPSVRNLARVSDLIAADLRRWRAEPLVVESFIDVPDAAVAIDAGFSARDAGTGVGDAGTGEAGASPCIDGGGQAGCTSEAFPDAASAKRDAAPSTNAFASGGDGGAR